MKENFVQYFFYAIFFLFNILIIKNCFAESPPTIYQVSTNNALIAGLYQGDINFKTLAKQGDFGLGSVNNMDGELIAINGKFYRIAPDGKMNIIPKNETTPYAIVTHFKPTIQFHISDIQSFKQLVNVLNQHLLTRNIPYAIHIKGQFTNVKLRAVRGAKPPYPPFMELVKKQAIFKLNNVQGDAVGFFFPIYLSKLDMPGYHIHFITTDRHTGGHILETTISNATVELMPLQQLTIKLPADKAFADATQLNDDNLKLMADAFGDGVQLN